MSKPRRFVRSSQDKPLTYEEEKAILDDPDFWKGWKEHLERLQAEERKNKFDPPVVFFDEV